MNYGVIGNCQVAALIDEQARMVWACLPRPDGDPVFSCLLQKEGGESRTGVFAIDMIDLTRTEQEYMRNSAILETRMYDSHGGVLRVVDFAPRFRSRGRVFRPMMFVRSVEPLAGRPTLRLRLREAHRGGEVDEAGVDRLPRQVDDARVSWRRDVRSDGFDDAVAYDHRATVDRAARDGLDARVGERPGPALRFERHALRGSGVRERGERGDGEHQRVQRGSHAQAPHG